MANGVNAQIERKVVRLNPGLYIEPGTATINNPEGEPLKDTRFLALGGFGCSSFTEGRKVYGRFLCDGEPAHVDGYSVIECREEDQPEDVDSMLERLKELGKKNGYPTH